MAIISPTSLLAANTVRATSIVTASAAVELPARPTLFLLACSQACYINFGTTSGVADASTSVYTIYLPANFSCIFRPPGRWMKTIRDTADGVIVLTGINESEAAKG
jgi:hypothetical protein